jgi:hypothetical protein
MKFFTELSSLAIGTNGEGQLAEGKLAEGQLAEGQMAMRGNRQRAIGEGQMARSPRKNY